MFPCPLSSLKWFQSCVAMKFRPVSPNVVRSQLAMSASHYTSLVGQIVPYSLRELCLSIIPQSLLATLFKSSNVHRKSFSCLLHHVLPVAEPSDVLCGTIHCFIGQFTSRCSRRCCRQAFPQIFKPSLPRALPAFFFLSHHQPSTSFQISPDLPEPSHPQGISCCLHSKHPILSASVSTPNQRCALRRAPFEFCRADALSSLARYGGHPSGGLRLLAGVPALLQAGVSPLSSSRLEEPTLYFTETYSDRVFAGRSCGSAWRWSGTAWRSTIEKSTIPRSCCPTTPSTSRACTGPEGPWPSFRLAT